MTRVERNPELIPSDSNGFGEEIEILRTELSKSFRQGRWQELSGILEELARFGQREGQRELCLRAQTLRELMSQSNPLGTGPLGSHASHLFEELLFQLDHVEWMGPVSTANQ